MDKNIIKTKSPGKCLICGGYLILSEKNSGIVFNVDAFIECESKYEHYDYDSKNEIVISAYSTYNNIEYRFGRTYVEGGETKYCYGVVISFNENGWTLESIVNTYG